MLPKELENQEPNQYKAMLNIRAGINRILGKYKDKWNMLTFGKDRLKKLLAK